jgi:ATP-binding cassette, subfamily B, bacterial PglK
VTTLPSGRSDRPFLTELSELIDQLGSDRRRELYILLTLMLAGAIAEFVSIGAVIPFLAILAGQAESGPIEQLTAGASWLAAQFGVHPITAATAMLVFIVLLAGAIRLQLTWLTQIFVSRLGHDLAVEIQNRTLFQPYSFHLEQSTSPLIATLDKVQGLVAQVLLPLLQAVIAAVLAAFIIGVLILVDPATALGAAVIFCGVYFLVSRVTRKRLAANSAMLGQAFDERIRIVQESAGGIRDIIIDGSQNIHLDAFSRVDRRLNDARATTAFIGAAPRFVIEAFGVALIAVVAVVVWNRDGSITGALPILGALALGAQRLLPLIQTVYLAWAHIAGHRSFLTQVLNLLSLQKPKKSTDAGTITPLPFKDRITLERVSFAYPTRRIPAIHDVTLEIPLGSQVALTGRTGSGKTTLADLLMGLLEPSEGRIRIDGVPLTTENWRRWRQNIAHVPQAIFLADTSIADNIALGSTADPDQLARVVDAARKAQLHEFIETLPDGYETIVGEGGIRLSGGQRQRLGIARAIYKNAVVLVLDEPTSALDAETEAAVMQALDSMRAEGRTIVTISHRPSALVRCDLVARLQNGQLVEVGSFEQVVGVTQSRSPRPNRGKK